jgi:hypothetical protein
VRHRGVECFCIGCAPTAIVWVLKNFLELLIS